MERVTIGIIKTGNIGISPLIDLVLDERADREDLAFIARTSGPKMDPESARDVAASLIADKPDLVLYSTPNAAIAGPKEVRKLLTDAGIPSIVFSDGPAVRAKEDFEAEGLGYVLIKGDPLIGARREFLDPTEMALFNADIIRVLSGTGVVRHIVELLDGAIERIKSGTLGSDDLPRIVITPRTVAGLGYYRNPYALAKAMAAYRMAETVAAIDFEACFKLKDEREYVLMACTAHEVLAAAARLVDEARDIEKGNDTVLRTSHSKSGAVTERSGLLEGAD
jgi:methylenetetrahydromethanopterin dehydrogenase